MEESRWEELFERAEAVVLEAISQMPPALKVEAERVACLFEKWPPEDQDVLGHYLSFEEQVLSAAPGPIVLYLGAIQQECEEFDLDFSEEVRITYLHELGHHFGLDEGDLEERGLL